MIRAAEVICWVLLVLDLVGLGTIYRMNPNNALGSSLAASLPFIFGLIALYSEPKRWKLWIAVILNGVVVLAGLLILVFAAQAGVPLVAAAIGFILVTCGVFVIVGLTRAAKKWRTAQMETG
jgi:peptidoglycan/LPS O-acetylase OafA/YrhL